MALLKGKYLPLSETNVGPIFVSSYDGQQICVNGTGGGNDVRFVMGNYLGGGIAGVVYEAFDKQAMRNVAIKILNPVGYKLVSPALLKRCEVVKKGTPIVGNVRNMTLENVYWVAVPNRRDLLACYVDNIRNGGGGGMISSGNGFGANTFNGGSASGASIGSSNANGTACNGNSSSAAISGCLRELTLEMCAALWRLDEPSSCANGYITREDPLNDPYYDDRSHLQHRHRSSRRTRTRPRSHHHLRVRRSDAEEMKVDTVGLSQLVTRHGSDHDLAQPHHQQHQEEAALEDDDDDEEDEEEIVQVGDKVYRIPPMPAKYRAFLQSRKSIYKEIAHMHKLTGNTVSGSQVGGGHENVLKLYDVLELIQASKSTIFLVLELAYGGELFDRIRSDNGIEEPTAKRYFKQLLSGVLFCHQLGIVHRDLKPENLLLSDSDVLKIADFGLSAHFIAAVSASEDALTGNNQPEDDDPLHYPARFRRLRSIVGSPHYVAPEVLQSARYGYDGRKADMWSIGVILYGLLVGGLPFGKELATCPRFLKFGEWIRSLPCDPHTGKLVYDEQVYQPGPIRVGVLTSTSSNDSLESFGYAGEDQTRVAYCPQPLHQLQASSMMNGNSTWWNSSGMVPACGSSSSSNPISCSSVNSVISNSDASCARSSSPVSCGGSSSLSTPSVIRRTSKVSFPGWFFPARLSPQATFLIASLLHPDPMKRCSCEDACKSNWVTDEH